MIGLTGYFLFDSGASKMALLQHTSRTLSLSAILNITKCPIISITHTHIHTAFFLHISLIAYTLLFVLNYKTIDIFISNILHLNTNKENEIFGGSILLHSLSSFACLPFFFTMKIMFFSLMQILYSRIIIALLLASLIRNLT